MIGFERVLRTRNVWTVVVTILGYSLYRVFNSWMPTSITRRFGVSLAESGTFVAPFVDRSAAATAVSLASVAGWLGSFVAPVVAGELVATAGTYGVLFVLAVGLGVTGGLTVWQMAESGESAAPA